MPGPSAPAHRPLALIDRRETPPEQHLAPKLQLFRSLVAGVNPARAFQLLELPFVDVEPLGLADKLVGREAKPFQVIADREIELVGRPLAVGVVDPEQERTAVLPREEEVVERGSDVADVQAARRRRREARHHAHRGSFVVGPVWKKLLIG